MISKNLIRAKIQLIAAFNFKFCKDNDQELIMDSKSDNIETMIKNKADEVIEELFQ